MKTFTVNFVFTVTPVRPNSIPPPQTLPFYSGLVSNSGQSLSLVSGWPPSVTVSYDSSGQGTVVPASASLTISGTDSTRANTTFTTLLNYGSANSQQGFTRQSTVPCTLDGQVLVSGASTGENVPYLGSALATPTMGAAPYTYLWSLSSGAITQGQGTATINFTDNTGTIASPTVTTATCKITDADGCTVTRFGSYTTTHTAGGGGGGGTVPGGTIGTGGPIGVPGYIAVGGNPGNPTGTAYTGAVGGGGGAGGTGFVYGNPGDPVGIGTPGSPSTNPGDQGQPTQAGAGTEIFTPRPVTTKELCPDPLLLTP